MPSDQWLKDLRNDPDAPGFSIIENVLARSTVDELSTVLDRASADESSSRRDRAGAAFALRNILGIPEITDLAESSGVRALIEPTLGPTAIPARGIFFDKTPEANWKVPWHQDLSIAVREKIDLPGFGPWSIKAGIPHVQPPLSILKNMLTIRLHLDDCDANNGPLLALPRSHAIGILDASKIAACRESQPSFTCVTSAGGGVLMRPLLLHASSVATTPRRRRVIHIEYSSGRLPGGLEWHR